MGDLLYLETTCSQTLLAFLNALYFGEGNLSLLTIFQKVFRNSFSWDSFTDSMVKGWQLI